MRSSIEIFQDPHAADDALLQAAEQIAPGGAPPALWSGVANDPAYRAFHRSVAVYELFRRHLPRPATLAQAAALCAGGLWLREATIEKIELMGGEIPVVVPAGGAAFIIRLPKDPEARQPDIGVYLALDRDLDTAHLRQALMGHVSDSVLAEIRICDFALFPRGGPVRIRAAG